MALNEDGLEPGQSVDFATMIRVNRQREAKANDSTEPKPAKRGRKAKESVHRPDEQSVQDSSEPTGTEEA